MAAALLAYDATINTDQRERADDRASLLGDGSNGARRQCAAAGRDDQGHRAAGAAAGERALYKRAISRSHAEWPLVEVCARAVVKDGAFQFVRLAAGGIAPVPLRLRAAEAALQGKPANALNIAAAAKQATSGAKPLPMTGYKLDLLEGVVQDLLEQLARTSVGRDNRVQRKPSRGLHNENRHHLSAAGRTGSNDRTMFRTAQLRRRAATLLACVNACPPRSSRMPADWRVAALVPYRLTSGERATIT